MIREEHRALESSRLKFVCHTCHLITIRLNMLVFFSLISISFPFKVPWKIIPFCKTVNVELACKITSLDAF